MNLNRVRIWKEIKRKTKREREREEKRQRDRVEITRGMETEMEDAKDRIWWRLKARHPDTGKAIER